ncbi:hypothetical protein ACJRO7_035548 [Eucalyptus globulus]|uniref:Lipoprotein n=1 Tax=Eucalyptus globulus TaxID=34317 RepID=A0ABD3J9Q3_EUCGL
MQLNLNKAVFLSYLLTVALSCEAEPGELNATTTPSLCSGLGGAAECRIAYQQPELELVAASNGFGIYKTQQSGPAGCDRGTPTGRRYTRCLVSSNPKPNCDITNRNYPHC